MIDLWTVVCSSNYAGWNVYLENSYEGKLQPKKMRMYPSFFWIKNQTSLIKVNLKQSPEKKECIVNIFKASINFRWVLNCVNIEGVYILMIFDTYIYYARTVKILVCL